MADTESMDESITQAGYAAGCEEQRPTVPDGSSDSTEERVLRDGLVLKGRYVLERKIGEGGMGVVFQARDLEEERISREHGGTVSPDRLAIKILQPELRAYVLAQLEELRKTRELVHQNIVRAGDCQQDGQLVFMTMELLEGRPLDKLLDRDFAQGIPWDLARTIIEDLGDGLGYAHDRGFVHCDLKPSNIFITQAFHPKILDFGIARAARSGRGDAESSLPAGLTPRYASPEMLRAWRTGRLQGYRPDRRDDIFAFGCIVYELLTGTHPFGDEIRDADEAAQQGWSLPEIAELTAGQRAALAEALAFDRAERTSKVEQFVQAFLAEEGGRGRTGRRSAPRPLRWRVLAGMAVASSAAAVGIVLWRAEPRIVPPAGLATPPPPQAALIAKLGIESAGNPAGVPATAAALRALVETAPRRVKLGSTGDEILDALSQCRQSGGDCSPDRYADERLRQALLRPYALDATPVSVGAFKEFVEATGYRTEAERESSSPAYHYTPAGLAPHKGETWRHSAAGRPARAWEPVVAVTFEDAQAYCNWKGARLPSENEWEYAARGPDRTLYPSGSTHPPAFPPSPAPPAVGSGPAEGIGGRFRNLSATVWEWTDTNQGGSSGAPGETSAKVLKGGSWQDTNPADTRAAVRRVSSAHLADDVSGFRCARNASLWPDAQLWLPR